ncbi:MAG: YkgJ family cysteine cluster protein [Candidatus Eisenbacteria bacterium]|nr:YkgJ family cysteine cluster protein [Candidatus Eisenbacteria bacterium]
MSRKQDAASRRVWYQEGLRFECTRCGRCCRDREVPSYVFLREEDIRTLAEHLGLSRHGLLETHCEPQDDCYVLRNRPGACVFYDDDRGCLVYEARPVQCRTWPFWPYNLRRKNWEEAAEFCPGCNRGALHPREAIEYACRQMLGGCGDGSLWPGEIPLAE